MGPGLPDRKVNCLLPLDGGELWVGTDRGVVRWNGSALTPDGVPQALRGVQALALLRDRDANVWVGHERAVLLRDQRRGVDGAARAPRRARAAR